MRLPAERAALVALPKKRAAQRRLSEDPFSCDPTAARVCVYPGNRVGFVKVRPIHMTCGAPAQVAVESVEAVEYSAWQGFFSAPSNEPETSCSASGLQAFGFRAVPSPSAS